MLLLCVTISDRLRRFPVQMSIRQPRPCPVRTSTSARLQVPALLSFTHNASLSQGITDRSILAAGIHYQYHIPIDNMGDLPEQGFELEPLAAIESNKDVQVPVSPDTPPTFTAPAIETKKKSMLNIFSRYKKDKVDKTAKDPVAPETAGNSSKAGADTATDKGERQAPATELEDDVPPVELEGDAPPVSKGKDKARATEPEGDAPPFELEGDAPHQKASRSSSMVLKEFDFDFAGPSSAAPPPADRVASDANPDPSVPTIEITPATPPRYSFLDGEPFSFLLTTPRHDAQLQAEENKRGNGSKPTDPGFRWHPLKVPEEPGDYPHITQPRNLKFNGDLPYQTRHVHIPLATHWVDHRPIAKYAGEPLFKLSKACPYILVPQILAARLQLIVETPLILPDEVKELAVERGLDVATLESYDIALLHILGALWDD